MERTIALRFAGRDGQKVELRKVVNLKPLNRAARSRSFLNASNCCGQKLVEKKFCSACEKQVEGSDFAKKLVKVGKDYVPVSAAALKANKDALDSEEIVFDVRLSEEPEDAQEWYDELFLVAPVKKKEADVAFLVAVGEKNVLVGHGVFGGHEYQLIGTTRNGEFQIRRLISAAQRYEIDRTGVKAKVSEELVEAVCSLLVKSTAKAYDFAAFTPRDEEMEAKLIEAALDGKTIEVAAVSETRKDSEELALIKGAL